MNKADVIQKINNQENEVTREDLIEALDQTLDAFEAFMDKANWGASFLDANTIRKTNEAPILAHNVLKKVGRR